MSLTKRAAVLVLLGALALGGAAGLIYQTKGAERPPARTAAGKAGKGPQPARADPKPRPDEEQLRGTWKLVEGAENGKKGKVEDEDATFTVRGETLRLKITRRSDGTPVDDRFFVFRLDATTTPRLIDLADWQAGFEGAGHVIEGVYSLRGDTLTVCFAFGAFGEGGAKGNRPTALESPEGSNTTVWTLKRQRRP
jgi:uncharacterized protein (TIGR03067 family)